METRKKNNDISGFSFLKDNAIFLREAFLEFKDTGTLFPTSRWAAQKLISPLFSRGTRKPLKILELGPGTGSVTVQILKCMQPQDELTVVEINQRFLDALKERMKPNPDFIAHQSRVKFFGCAIQELEETAQFDVIVCAIPFLNLDLSTVEDIFVKLRSMSHSDTVMTYYEYIGLRQLGMAVSPPKRRERLKQIDGFFKGIFPNHLCERFKVYKNVLPINIYLLKDINSLPVDEDSMMAAAV